MGVKCRGIFRLPAASALGRPAKGAFFVGQERKKSVESLPRPFSFLVPFALLVELPCLRTFCLHLTQLESMEQPHHAQPFQCHAPVSRLVAAFVVWLGNRFWSGVFDPFAEIS